MRVNIYEHAYETGYGKHSPGGRFDTRGFYFHCPLCDFKLPSYDFQDEKDWEQDCVDHLVKVHGGREVERATVEMPQTVEDNRE